MWLRNPLFHEMAPTHHHLSKHRETPPEKENRPQMVQLRPMWPLLQTKTLLNEPPNRKTLLNSEH